MKRVSGRGKKNREVEKKEVSMTCRVKIGKEIVTVVCVYRRRGEEEGWNTIKRWTERKEKDWY